jgi:hypothetical protein
MAIGRYDQRKNLEEEEANAIGTEYARADLLPAPESDNLRRLLRQYLDQRILFYKVRNRQTLQQINAATAQLQDRLWASAKEPSSANPTAITALIIAGMNDVLNSQSYVQAGWSNQIPRSAWLLLDLIAICSNVMVGLSFRTARSKRFLILILPFVVSISLFLIADIDSPRGGLIHVEPENLRSLAQSLRT